MELAHSWSALASLRLPGFSWDGTEYAASRRGLAIDRVGLAKHCAPLQELLRLASSGFPAHARVRDALQHLHSKFRIFGDVPAQDVFRIAAAASDRWRIMAKDTDLLAKQGNADSKLHPLVRLIDMGESTGSSCASLGTSDGDALWPSFDGLDDDIADDGDKDDVEIAPTDIDDAAEHDIDGNSHELAARSLPNDDDAELQLVSVACKCHGSASLKQHV